MKIAPVQNYKFAFKTKNQYSNNSYITDPSGKFYAGMTLSEAIADGTDSSFWNRDFGNLDKDNDGILSVEEIFDERNRAIKNYKISAGIFTVLAPVDAFIPGSAAEKFAFLLLDVAFIISDIIGIHNIEKGNKRYKRMMENNSIM